MTPDRNGTRATLVEGGRSHHCAIPAPKNEYKNGTKTLIFRVRAHFLAARPVPRFALQKQRKDWREKAKAWSHRINRLSLLCYTYQPDDKRRRYGAKSPCSRRCAKTNISVKKGKFLCSLHRYILLIRARSLQGKLTPRP